MSERIRELERRAAALEPDPATRAAWLTEASRYAEAYLESLPALPAYLPDDERDAGLLEASIGEEGIGIREALDLLGRCVDRSGVTEGSAGFLGFIPGSGLYGSALGDYLAAVVNRYVGVTFAGPGAVRLERTLLAWLASELGYPPQAAGDLTSGGSLANLTAIVAAREARGLRATELPRTVVYLSAQGHHSLSKGLRIAGLGDCVQRLVPLDGRYRMDPEALRQAIAEDRKRGLEPWLLLASAGTTDTGAVDPLTELAELARAEGLWLHVDGAYGAAFALCREGKRTLRGLERSDSLVIDPHKGLFLPFGSGAVLLRRGEVLRQAFTDDASYLQDKDSLAASAAVSPADLSLELSRPFRGLRLWLPLVLAGVAPFRAALEEKLLLARHAHRRLAAMDGFSVGPEPDLSIVTFRYLPAQGDADAFNRQLVAAVQRDGRVFLSSTTLDGAFTLRLAILGFRTHLDTIDLTLDILAAKARELSAG